MFLLSRKINACCHYHTKVCFRFETRKKDSQRFFHVYCQFFFHIPWESEIAHCVAEETKFIDSLKKMIQFSDDLNNFISFFYRILPR